MNILWWTVKEEQSEEDYKKEFDEDWKKHIKHYKSLDKEGQRKLYRNLSIFIYLAAIILILMLTLLVPIVMIVSIFIK